LQTRKKYSTLTDIPMRDGHEADPGVKFKRYEKVVDEAKQKKVTFGAHFEMQGYLCAT